MSDRSFTCKRGDRKPSIGRCDVAGCGKPATLRCAHEKVNGPCDRPLCEGCVVTVNGKPNCPLHAGAL